MFPPGSARMFERTQKLMQQVAKVIQGLPNKLSITGHTDATPFRGGPRGYGNWELSGDRAQASRRVLVEAGFDPARISAVAGRAERELLLPDDPNSPRNRRISLVLLREATEAARRMAAKAAAAPTVAAPAEFKRDWTGPRVR
jgi:chemotaxis protein MotB